MQQHSENQSTDPGRHDNTPRWVDCTMSTRPDAGAYDAPTGSVGEASKSAKPAVLCGGSLSADAVDSAGICPTQHLLPTDSGSPIELAGSLRMSNKPTMIE
jgi:hypothetical protein